MGLCTKDIPKIPQRRFVRTAASKEEKKSFKKEYKRP
jgi:hypothetical protein